MKQTTRVPKLAAALLLAVALGFLVWPLFASSSSLLAREVAGARSSPPSAPAVPLAPLGKLNTELELQRDLDAIVSESLKAAGKLSANTKGPKIDAGNTTVSFTVLDRASGEQVALRAPERALIPASNLKLATSAAALTLLGVGFQFQTQALAGGPLQNGVLQGDLVLRAGGDPLYAEELHGAVEGRLGALVQALVALGLREVRGRVVLDEGLWGAPAPGPEWPAASQHWADYCARVAGFSLNGGVLVATVRPTRAGAPASLEVHPWPTGLAESFGVQTVAGSTNDVRIGATLERATVQGSLGASAQTLHAGFSHSDPVLLFGSVLVERLRQAGIEVAGGLARERNAPAQSLLATLSTPLVEYLDDVNTYSVNPVADAIFLRTGEVLFGAPTRANGQAAVARALTLLGVSVEGFVQVDGSGLSKGNRISTRQLATLVRAVLAGEPAAAHALYDSLAIAGQTGTLEDRMQSGPAAGRVRAKTGFVAGASALSGVLSAKSGREFVFSILVGYPDLGGLNNSIWKPMQDRLCERLARE